MSKVCGCLQTFSAHLNVMGTGRKVWHIRLIFRIYFNDSFLCMRRHTFTGTAAALFICVCRAANYARLIFALVLNILWVLGWLECFAYKNESLRCVSMGSRTYTYYIGKKYNCIGWEKVILKF